MILPFLSSVGLFNNLFCRDELRIYSSISPIGSNFSINKSNWDNKTLYLNDNNFIIVLSWPQNLLCFKSVPRVVLSLASLKQNETPLFTNLIG